MLRCYDIGSMDQEFLSQIPWLCVVIDEVGRLKNPSSVCKTAFQLVQKTCFFPTMWDLLSSERSLVGGDFCERFDGSLSCLRFTVSSN